MNKKLYCVMLVLIMVSCEFKYPQPTASQTTTMAQATMMERAVTAVPIPEVSYFQERRTIAKWAERWDVPNLPCFVYLISYGNIIGYYVTDGKPASINSFLMPEEAYQRMSYGENSGYSYQWNVTTAPDIDGTWGQNNVGIRFFTAEGVAVEWGGTGASYLYSDAPLPINVPKLNVAP